MIVSYKFSEHLFRWRDEGVENITYIFRIPDFVTRNIEIDEPIPTMEQFFRNPPIEKVQYHVDSIVSKRSYMKPVNKSDLNKLPQSVKQRYFKHHLDLAMYHLNRSYE